MASADGLGIRGASVGQAMGEAGGVTDAVPLPPRSYLSRLAGEFSGDAMSEHTKTPWGAHPWFNDQVLITDDLLARHIAVTCSGVLEKHANAAFIVTACNAFYAMKQALQAIAKPALGGKEQQYRAQQVLAELFPDEAKP